MSPPPAEGKSSCTAGAARGRRSLLLSLGAAASALGVTGCGSASTHSHPRQPTHPRGGGPDGATLNRLLRTEYYAIAAYTAATPLLGGVAARVARQFLGQEVLHADRLINLIEKAGGQPERAQASYDLGHPRGTRELMNMLLAAEQTELNAYVEAAPLLGPGPLRAAAASILATQARHAAIWRLQLGQTPAPSAFVMAHG